MALVENRGRASFIVVAWVIVVIPAMIFGWRFLSWVMLAFLAMAIYTSWDYYRIGGLFDPIDGLFQKVGTWILAPWRKRAGD